MHFVISYCKAARSRYRSHDLLPVPMGSDRMNKGHCNINVTGLIRSFFLLYAFCYFVWPSSSHVGKLQAEIDKAARVSVAGADGSYCRASD